MINSPEHRHLPCIIMKILIQSIDYEALAANLPKYKAEVGRAIDPEVAAHFACALVEVTKAKGKQMAFRVVVVERHSVIELGRVDCRESCDAAKFAGEVKTAWETHQVEKARARKQRTFKEPIGVGAFV
jgi:hypothetical protein